MPLGINMCKGSYLYREWNLSKCASWSWCTLLLLASVFRMGISSVKDDKKCKCTYEYCPHNVLNEADVRCYCNLPECTTRGYICKSASGLCISQRSNRIRGPSWTKHACVETFTALGHSRPVCPEQKERTIEAGFFCCQQDMCNYPRLEELSHVTNDSQSPETFLTLREHGGRLFPHQQRQWVRYAVIAVPIAGGCVLVLLIVTTTRLLKKDMKSQQCQIKSFVFPAENEQLPSQRRILPKSLSSVVVVTHPPPLNRNCVSSASLNVLQQTALFRNVPHTFSSDTTCTDASREKYFVFDV